MLDSFIHTYYIEPIDNGLVVKNQASKGKEYYKTLDDLFTSAMTEEVRERINQNEHLNDPTELFELTISFKPLKSKGE